MRPAQITCKAPRNVLDRSKPIKYGLQVPPSSGGFIKLIMASCQNTNDTRGQVAALRVKNDTANKTRAMVLIVGYVSAKTLGPCRKISTTISGSVDTAAIPR
mmetsp:Transcript_14932/g.32105  ORF Transcript_14932/g.32105 Transcript_14932/m.32105 type:complete len:102 (+) Transcript_14932:213-518(+)